MAVDLDVVCELAALGLAPEEVLAEVGAFGEDPAALPGFAGAWRQGRALGRARMKRAAHERALAGDLKAIALLLEWLDDSPPEEAKQPRRAGRQDDRDPDEEDEEDERDEPPDDIFDEGAICVRSIEHPNGSIERYALRDPAAPSPRHPDEFPLKALPAGSPVQDQMRRRNQAIRDAAGITEPMVSGGPLPIPTLPASGQAPPFSDPLPPTQVGSGG
jgi:hypothetical protein